MRKGHTDIEQKNIPSSAELGLSTASAPEANGSRNTCPITIQEADGTAFANPSLSACVQHTDLSVAKSTTADDNRNVAAPSGDPVNPGNSLPGISFISIPDFILADWYLARPKFRLIDKDGHLVRGRKRIGQGLHWAIHQAVILQKTSRVIVADVALAQVVWGGERTRADYECFAYGYNNNRP